MVDSSFFRPDDKKSILADAIKGLKALLLLEVEELRFFAIHPEKKNG